MKKRNRRKREIEREFRAFHFKLCIFISLSSSSSP